MDKGTAAIARAGSAFGRLAAFFGNRRGVAAIEFAFLAPVLLMLYFVTVEVSLGIETNKKVGRAASMIADLVTQQQKTSFGELDAIMQIAESTLQPYNRTRPSIFITGINISDEKNPKATAAWSRKMVNGSTSKGDETAGTTTTVPAELKIRNTFLIRVVVKLDYRPVVVWSADAKQTLGLMSAFDNIDMSERYYLRPRISQSIACPDC